MYRGGKIARIENEHLPLDVDEQHAYTSRRIPCQPDDLFVLVSDGLTEVPGDDGEVLGLEPLEAILSAHASEPLPAVASHGPQDDDRSLLLVRVRS